MNVVFIVLTQHFCADNQAIDFLNELRIEYSRDRSSATSRSSLSKLSQKYIDLAREDKTSVLEQKLGETKVKVQGALNNMIDAREQAFVYFYLKIDAGHEIT